MVIIDWNQYKKFAFDNSLILSYYKDNFLVLRINNEKIKFDKETLLPSIHTVVMKENNTTQENCNQYYIELEKVTDDDIKIPSDYKLIK